MNKEYYEILGVSKDASEDDIKKAYKNLAKEHHPDVAKNKEEAEKKFKEINEAYQVLKDPQKRKQYDQFGSAAFNGGAGGGNPFGGGQGQGPFTYQYTWGGGDGQSPFGDVDPFDIFEEVFGFRGFGGARRPRKGKNLYYSLNISFVDSIKGTTKKIRVGKDEFDVKIPAGVNNGTELKLEGKGGEAPEKGMPNGDLFLSLEVDEDSIFVRQGYDLFAEHHISISQAVLGDKIKVRVIDPSSSDGFGEVSLKIPSGTQSGTNFRLSEKGMPRLRGNGRGDIYYRIKVEIPTKINRQQKKLFEELKSL